MSCTTIWVRSIGPSRYCWRPSRDPLSTSLRTTLGRIYLSANRTEEALEQLRVSAALNPAWSLTHGLVGHALIAQGASEEALAAFERAASIGGAADSVQLAYGLAVVVERARAEHLLSALARERPDAFNFECHVAGIRRWLLLRRRPPPTAG